MLHQEGELEKAVQLYKQVIKIEPLGEAYATLSKVLADQGKHDLSEKAMLKATRLHNEQLARPAAATRTTSLFWLPFCAHPACSCVGGHDSGLAEQGWTADGLDELDAGGCG